MLKEKIRPAREVIFSIHPHNSEFGSMKEQPRSSQVSIMISDGMAAFAKLVLESENRHSF